MTKTDKLLYIREMGNLYLYDVLMSYIYPRVFVCEDEFGCKFLFYEMASSEEKDEWLVSKIKKQEYYDLVDRKRSIQSIYSKAAGRDLFSIRNHYGEREYAERLPEYKIWLESLPEKEVYAEKEIVNDLATETLQVARETGSTTLDIRLYPGTDRHFVPQSILSALLKNVSSLADSVFGRRHSSSLRICTVPGSCVVRFSFGDQVNLLDESSATEEVKIINDALCTGSIESSLRRVKNKGGFIQSYSNLLKTIKKAGSSVQVTSANPNSTETTIIELNQELVSQRSDDMDNIYNERISEQTIKGSLIALDIKSKRFKLSVAESSQETLIIGSLDDSLLNASFEIPGSYIAEIKKTEHIDRDDFSPKTTYHLTRLQSVL